MNYPIPLAALDDRLAFVGTSGSGKTYAAGTAVEKLLHADSRVIIFDPLGVWHGLRLDHDGQPGGFDVVIMGGPFGDLPLSERAAPEIGRAIASASESIIIDLTELPTKASERRVMLGLLTALYQSASGEPVHLVFDEADEWAPQTVYDKDGEAMKLKGRMSDIVRRGRVKGFIPWLITQRPAVIAKDVLSQADGLVAMRLISSQDRAALDAWVGGQADETDARNVRKLLPTLERGTGLVWIPGRGVMASGAFPQKITFDSSRQLKRGEKRHGLAIRPLDIEGLRHRLAEVEQEAKANDPAALKAEIERLTKALSISSPTNEAAKVDSAALESARREARAEGVRVGKSAALAAMKVLWSTAGQNLAAIADIVERAHAMEADEIAPAAHAETMKSGQPATSPKPVASHPERVRPSMPAREPAEAAGSTGALSRSELKILEALAALAAFGFGEAERAQLASFAGYSKGGGRFANLLGGLRSQGFIEYRATLIALTDAGRGAAPSPDLALPARTRLAPVLDASQAKVLDALPRDGTAIPRVSVAEASGYDAGGGRFANILGSLRTLGVIHYPDRGLVAAQSWVWL